MTDISKRIKKLERSVPRQDVDAVRRVAAFLLDEVDRLALLHKEVSEEKFEQNYDTFVQLCLNAPESSLDELKADGRLEEFILKTCKGGYTYANN